MKILYVTNIWTGFKHILFDGTEEIKGMPAFLLPLKELILRGHEVEIVLIHSCKNFPEFNIKVSWLDESMIIKRIRWIKKGYMIPLNMIKIYLVLCKLFKNNTYDFVYGHGALTDPARKASNKYGIPYGQRLYGTFFYNKIKTEGLLKTIIRNYPEYKCFVSKKCFLMITNDGTRGNEVARILNNGRIPYELFFWLNGVRKIEGNIVENKEIKEINEIVNDEPFLLYVARIDKWKRQDEAIKIVKKLHDNNIKIKLLIIGQIYNPEYMNELKSLVDKCNLKKYVIFTGVLDFSTIVYLAQKAVAALSLYEVSNMGNVFHELFTSGAVIIAKDDGSLDDFIINKENGFLVKNIDEAVNCVKILLNDKNYEKKIKLNAKKTSKSLMKNWDERVDDEIKLIESYVKNK